MNGDIIPRGGCKYGHLMCSRDSALDNTPGVPFNPNHFVPIFLIPSALQQSKIDTFTSLAVSKAMCQKKIQAVLWRINHQSKPWIQLQQVSMLTNIPASVILLRPVQTRLNKQHQLVLKLRKRLPQAKQMEWPWNLELSKEELLFAVKTMLMWTISGFISKRKKIWQHLRDVIIWKITGSQIKNLTSHMARKDPVEEDLIRHYCKNIHGWLSLSTLMDASVFRVLYFRWQPVTTLEIIKTTWPWRKVSNTSIVSYGYGRVQSSHRGQKSISTRTST